MKRYLFLLLVAMVIMTTAIVQAQIKKYDIKSGVITYESINSFDLYEGNKYKTNTEIQIQVTTRKSEIAMQEEAEEKMDKQAEELSRSLKSKPPTEKDLGAPIYPGAQFNADASAGMSLDNDYKMYIYLTTDPPSKVVAFYEQNLKRKAEEPTKGHFLIPLKGKMPMPDEGISIEPNTMFGGSAKTVITIQKMTGKND